MKKLNLVKLVCGALFFALFLPSFQTQAAEWQYMGDSNVGKHYLDRTTLIWEENKTSFSLLTRVLQPDEKEWLLRMQVDCKSGSYAYINGTKSLKDQVFVQFDTPQPFEKIVADSMPDQVRREYCEAPTQENKQWEFLGKSNIADVYYDPSSIRFSKEAKLFIAETRVQPFDKNEETLSRLSFNCDNRTFNVLRMSRVKAGKIENVFDKPQPAAPTSKTATLDKLADQYCTGLQAMNTEEDTSIPPATGLCDVALREVQAIEAEVQTDFDMNNLKCKRVNGHIEQLERLNQTISQNACAIGDLTDYMKSIRDAGCKQ